MKKYLLSHCGKKTNKNQLDPLVAILVLKVLIQASLVANLNDYDRQEVLHRIHKHIEPLFF